MRFISILTVAASLSLVAPAQANDLMAANQEVAVARSDLVLTPDRDWNKLSARPGRNSETWTLDGELLNDLSFYGGIENDRTLFREVNRRNRPLPRFNATMLPTDIPSLLENSYRIAREVSVFTIERQEPVQFAGQNGIHFSYSFVGPDELRRSGEAQAAIINGRLYMATFEAPATFFFAKDVDSFRRMVVTARISTTRR